MQDSNYGVFATLAGVGALIGIGQLLLSEEKVTLRRALGRAIVTAGLSVGAAAALVLIPNLPNLALVGLAATVASLGTTGLERIIEPMIQKFLPGSGPKAG